MIEIDLTADVPVECHIIHAAVSTTDKQYILPVLIHVQDMNGKATSKSLSDDLFPGLEPLSQKLLEMCKDADLIHTVPGSESADQSDCAQYEITAEGKSATDAKQVFVGKAGRMWKIYYARHPMIPQRRRLLEMSKDPAEAGYEPAKHRGDQIEVTPVPSHLLDLAGEKLTLPKTQEVIRIDEIGSDSKSIKPDMQAALNWHLTKEESVLSLKLNTPEGDYAPVFSNGIGYQEVLGRLMRVTREWNEELECLNVPFDDTNADERRTLRRIMPFDNPDMGGPKFKLAVVKVPLRPKNDVEAQKWANWLLGDRVGRRVGSDQYQKWTKEIIDMLAGSSVGFLSNVSDYFEGSGSLNDENPKDGGYAFDHNF